MVHDDCEQRIKDLEAENARLTTENALLKADIADVITGVTELQATLKQIQETL